MSLQWSLVVAAMGFLACDRMSQPPTEPVGAPPGDSPVGPTTPDEYNVPLPEFPVLSQPESFDLTIDVDTRVPHQTIAGFGASMRIFSDPHMIGASGGIENALQIGQSDQEAILLMLYRDVGLTRARPVLQITSARASAEAVPRRDWVFADGHIDIVKRAASIGLRQWWLSPLSLETWMDGTSVSEYVQWAFGNIKYWREKGAELAYYSIVNEPNLRQITGEFLRDAVRGLGLKFRAEGFQTKLVIPDDISPSFAAEKAAVVLGDPDARPFVGAIATHLYGVPVSAMSKVAAVAKQYGIPLWMSEFYVEDERPVVWAGLVSRLIGDYDVAAVDYMWGFFGSHERTSLVSIDQTEGRFVRARISGPGYAMAQYARYVRPGSVRVSAVSSEPDVRVTAFMRAGKLTIVVVNERTLPVKSRISASGLSSLTRMSLVRTSAGEKLAGIGRLDISGNTFTVELPPESISTLVQLN